MYRIFIKYVLIHFIIIMVACLLSFCIIHFTKDKQILRHCVNAGIVLQTVIGIYFLYPVSTVPNFCSYKGLNGIIRKGTVIPISMFPLCP